MAGSTLSGVLAECQGDSARQIPHSRYDTAQPTSCPDHTYRPGVTLLRHNITITGQFTSCKDSIGEVTSGSYGEQFTIFVGCNDLLDGFTGQRTITRNTGDAGVVEGTGQSTAVAGQVITTITATVIQGRFQGRTVLEVIPLPQPGLLQCLTTGFTSATGLTTLTITWDPTLGVNGG
jgi:hypothetical protein